MSQGGTENYKSWIQSQHKMTKNIATQKCKYVNININSIMKKYNISTDITEIQMYTYTFQHYIKLWYEYY